MENKNKKYINKVLENVNEEAQKYIQVSAFYINLNAQTDSVAYQILNDELTLADYWNDRDTQKFDLGTVTQSSRFNLNLINDLNKHLDYLSSDEKGIFKQLQFIKRQDVFLKNLTENTLEIVAEQNRYQKRNHDWYYSMESDSLSKRKEYKYRLNNFRYKNYIRDYKNNELVAKSAMYSYGQCLSIQLLISTIKNQRNKELEIEEVDSILQSNRLAKLKKLPKDSVYGNASKYKLFDRFDMINFFINASTDTITIKKQNDTIPFIAIPPGGFKMRQIPYGTVSKVFVKDSLAATYVTAMNSYLLYE